MEFYCHNCETPQYHDELSRAIDFDHRGSFTTYLCGHCQADDIEELDHAVWCRIFKDAIDRLDKIRRAEVSGHSLSVSRKLGDVQDLFVKVLEYVEEL